MLEFIKQYINWSVPTFWNCTAKDSWLKLVKEVSELQLAKTKEEVADEIADCMMCLIDMAGRANISPVELNKTIWTKFELNKNRKWYKAKDGFYQSLKDIPGIVPDGYKVVDGYEKINHGDMIVYGKELIPIENYFQQLLGVYATATGLSIVRKV